MSKEPLFIKEEAEKLGTNSLQKQIKGDHYKNMAIQPVEFCHANNIPFLEGCIIKYVCRYKSKGGIDDLNKAIHFLEMLKQLEYGNKDKGIIWAK